MNGNTKKNYDPLDPLGGASLANQVMDPGNVLDLRDKDGNYDPWHRNRNSNRDNHFAPVLVATTLTVAAVAAAYVWSQPKDDDVAEAQASRNSTDAGAKHHTSQPRVTVFPSALPVEPRAEESPTPRTPLESGRHKQAILPEKSVGTAVAARLPAPAAGPPTAPWLHRLGDIELAIICALPLEYDAISLVFDDEWEEDGGNNAYKTGRIGKHNVVLALLSDIGRTGATKTATDLRSSYPRLRLFLVVGICGGVPQTDKEILLGDVVISEGIVPYDSGKQYPDRFKLKDSIHWLRGSIRNEVTMFGTDDGKGRLKTKTADFLRQLQAKAPERECRANYSYPGADEDKLFKPGYRHKHHLPRLCICSECVKESDPVCADAIKSSCNSLGCNEKSLVPRQRLVKKRESTSEKAQDPDIHLGVVGSGDTVFKSGQHRDRIAEEYGIIAFEMEAAGIIGDDIPCVVVKGVCDYADCHKNKKWQDFAAATAASALKAILETIPASKTQYLLPALFFFGFASGFVALAWVIFECTGVGGISFHSGSGTGRGSH